MHDIYRKEQMLNVSNNINYESNCDEKKPVLSEKLENQFYTQTTTSTQQSNTTAANSGKIPKWFKPK